MRIRAMRGVLIIVGGLCFSVAAFAGAASSPASGQSAGELEKSLYDAFSADPHSYDALASYIHFLNQQGRTDDATLVLRSATDVGVSTDLLWAETHWYGGDAEAARKRIDSVPAGDPALKKAALDLRIRIDYLDGDVGSTETQCRQLLAQDPLNKTARLFLSRLLIRRGRYDEASALLQAADAAYPSDASIIECRAELLDAQGKPEEAGQLRRSAIEAIVAHPPDSVDGLVAASSLLGMSGEPRAANECLQTAARFAPADPFLALEKVRLHRRVHDMLVAAVTAKKLLDRYKKCPLALAEFAEAYWELRRDAEQTECMCKQATAMDPTLLDSRCLLITLHLISGDYEGSEMLIAENRAINTAHVETENLATAAAFLKAGKLSVSQAGDSVQSPAQSSLMGEILAARANYEFSGEWFAKSLQANPEDWRTLKAAGLALLRSAEFDDATALLENAFNRNRYDVTLKNVLDFLDEFHASQTVNDGEITVGFQAGEELTADYTVFLARRFIQEVSKRLGISVAGPLRLQLCASRDDVSVLTEGIPPTCACGSLPQGSLYFKSTVFVWAPSAARGGENLFRFDEALHRGIVEHVVEKGIGPNIPHWVREGLAQHAGSVASPEWQSPLMEPLIAFLQSGGSFPLEQLEATLVANRNPLCRPYAGLVVGDWVERHGLDGVLHVLARISGGEDWTAAVEAQFGAKVSALDAEARAAILDRFASIRLEPPLRMTPGALAASIPQTDASTIELARMYLSRQRYDDAERSLAPLLSQESPPATALLLAGRAAFGRGDYSSAKDRIGLGLDIEKLRQARIAVDKDYEVLGLALVKLGDSDNAREAFRKSIELNPFDATENGPYSQLLTLLEKLKSEEYYALLEQRLPVRRTDPRPRMELAQWYEAQGDSGKALELYQSAAGIRPDWIELHRQLASLALRVGKVEEAYASLRILSRKQPKDVRVLQQLAECASTLGRTHDANEYTERLHALGADVEGASLSQSAH